MQFLTKNAFRSAMRMSQLCIMRAKLLSTFQIYSFSNNSNSDLITQTQIKDVLETRMGYYESDLEDPEGWLNYNDITQLFQRYIRVTGKKYLISDTIKFLMRVVELLQSSNATEFPRKYRTNLQAIVTSIPVRLRNSDQEYPLIGSYTYCVWFLKNEIQGEHWLTLADHIASERLRKSPNEIRKATIGLTNLSSVINDKELVKTVFGVLQKELEMIQKGFSASDYELILKSFAGNGFFPSSLFTIFEKQILQSLSRAWNLDLAIEIAQHYAVTSHGSREFYQTIFELIEDDLKSKMPESSDILHSGKMLASLVLIINLSFVLHPELETSNLRRLVSQLCTDPKVKYSVLDLVKLGIHGNLVFEEDKLNELIESRIFGVEGEHILQDMLEYIDLLQREDIDPNIFEKIMKQVETLCLKALRESEAAYLLEFLAQIEERRILWYLEGFIKALPAYVVLHIRHYDFEKMCFLYYFFRKHEDLLDMSPESETKMNLGILKEYIKLHYASIPRHRIPIESNFYKVLEVVDINEFFMQHL